MPYGYRHGGFMNGFGGHGGGLFALLLLIVFWGAVVLLILTLVQNYRRGPRHLHEHHSGPGSWRGPGHGPANFHSEVNPAIDILKERFARGEVSEEEFTRRLSLLKES